MNRFKRDESILKNRPRRIDSEKENRTRVRTGAADLRISGAWCLRASRAYAIALMRVDRRESLRAAVLRFITPTRALR